MREAIRYHSRFGRQAVTTADEKSLLKRCPRCGYSMRGLAVQHRCPECGFDVDRRWRVFGGSMFGVDTTRAVKPVRVVLVGVAILFAAQLVAYLIFVPMRAALIPLAFWTVMIGGALLLAFRRPKSFIAVGPRGLFIYRGARGSEHLAWSSIEPLPLGRLPNAITLRVDGREMMLRSYEFFHWHFWEIDRCASSINTYARGEKAIES